MRVRALPLTLSLTPGSIVWWKPFGSAVHRACLPKLLRDRHGRDLHVYPPVCLVAMPVELLVVLTAEGHRELVADLPPQ